MGELSDLFLDIPDDLYQKYFIYLETSYCNLENYDFYLKYFIYLETSSCNLENCDLCLKCLKESDLDMLKAAWKEQVTF